MRDQKRMDGGFYRWTRPKARKEHVCTYCNRTIYKGEKYSSCTGIGEPTEFEWWTLKACNRCEVADLSINPENNEIVRPS